MKISSILKPHKWAALMIYQGWARNWPDEAFLKLRYFAEMNRRLNLKNPTTFNEKLQWMKLHDRKPIYTDMVDKYKVRSLVQSAIGQEYLIPLLGVWEKPEDIDFDALPDQFVLKCNHNSGLGLCICRDKKALNIDKVRRELSLGLAQNYYKNCREWPYKNVAPKIIAEKYMEDDLAQVLPVYKFFCFGGESTLIQAIQNDKQPNETIDYFDTKWNRLELRQNYPNSESPLPKPALLEEMVETARTLAQVKKDFIRVDLYLINGHIYFSEYTFFSDAGFAAFEPEKWDKILGDMIVLPKEER